MSPFHDTFFGWVPCVVGMVTLIAAIIVTMLLYPAARFIARSVRKKRGTENDQQ